MTEWKPRPGMRLLVRDPLDFSHSQRGRCPQCKLFHVGPRDCPKPEHRCKRCFGSGFHYPSPGWFEAIGVKMPLRHVVSYLRAEDRDGPRGYRNRLKRCDRCGGDGYEPLRVVRTPKRRKA